MYDYQENTTMHGVLNIMDSCYLKQTIPIHFWTGGLALKTKIRWYVDQTHTIVARKRT